MTGTLTGSAAAQAIGVYARLGAAGARFDGGLVAASVRSHRGRLRVRGALACAMRAHRRPPARPRAGACRARRSPAKRTRACRDDGPSRPACAREGRDRG